ncbi:aldo/keto reductase [Listeria ivanovii]|uniref:aldo/keto reductase n=1 Tax=Listeria ivanovii TaxID=1638 RepID=UPI000DA836D0|nr:aldo/keto reductase [Listeria ivanovii]PZG37028.1 aldo/keto reductase [Listeria ivanovii]
MDNLARMGLGCGRMSDKIDDDSRKESIATIHAALDAGISFLNTADFYGTGHNEMLIGEALKGYKRDKAFVSLKFGALMEPNGKMYGLDVNPKHIKNYLAQSLKRLNLDYVDLYQPARIDLAIPVEETIGVIADLVREGYVKNIGVTQVDAETFRKANAVHPIKFIEAEYSLFNRTIEKDIVPTARELGVGVVAFGALAHGMLNGTWKKDTTYGYNSMIPLYAKENIGKNLQLVEALREITNEKEMTIPQLAFAWLLAKGEDILPLIGSTRIASLKDSLKALDIKLTSDDMKQIEVAMPVNEIAGASFPDMRFRNGEVVR